MCSRRRAATVRQQPFTEMLSPVWMLPAICGAASCNFVLPLVARIQSTLPTSSISPVNIRASQSGDTSRRANNQPGTKMRPVSSQSEDGGRTYIEENRIFANLTAGGYVPAGCFFVNRAQARVSSIRTCSQETKTRDPARSLLPERTKQGQMALSVRSKIFQKSEKKTCHPRKC